jgi:hypothetical protein
MRENIEKLTEETTHLHNRINEKDEIFKEHRAQSTVVLGQLKDKER